MSTCRWLIYSCPFTGGLASSSSTASFAQARYERCPSVLSGRGAALNISLKIFLPTTSPTLSPPLCPEFIFKLLSTGFLGFWQWVLPEIWESVGVSTHINQQSLLKLKSRIHTTGKKKKKKTTCRKSPFPCSPNGAACNRVQVGAHLKARGLQGCATATLYRNCFNLYYESCFKDRNKRSSPIPNKINSKTTV